MEGVVNERGERLVAVHDIGEAEAASMPVAFALVLGLGEGGFLLAHNTHRNVWELPGGLLDKGESARQCALRELAEETGQPARSLRWRALLELDVPHVEGTPIRYGALYCARIPEYRPFLPNREIDRIGFWSPEALPERVSAIDAVLLGCYR